MDIQQTTIKVQRDLYDWYKLTAFKRHTTLNKLIDAAMEQYKESQEVSDHE